ncbi:MAG: TIGR03545 family protein, partial [Elusimicrobia bacterium]|nr:TIGR03545 family protein [Candidatus Obscuribacterium magneticum]
NLVEAGPLNFELSLGDLLSKRVIVPEARVEGIGFGTARKTSGALAAPRKEAEREEKKGEKAGEPSAAAKLAEKYKDQFKLNFEGMKTDFKGKIDFDPKETAIVKQADALKEKSDKLPEEWQTKIKSLDVEGRLKKVERDLQNLKSTPTQGPEVLAALPESLKKLGQVKKDLGQLQTDIKGTKDSLSGEVKTLKSDVKGLENAKKKDVDDIMSRLNLDVFSPKKLAEGFFGASVMNRVQTALHYVQLARKYMPSKKEEESVPPPPVRSKGVDIRFREPTAPPRFWLKKAALSGAFQDIAALGGLLNLNSNPSRVGKPTTMDLKGAKGNTSFILAAVVDHITDVKRDRVRFEAKGMNVQEMMGGSLLGNALTGGQGNVTLSLTAVGEDEISGQLMMNMSSLKIDSAALLKEAGVMPASTPNLSSADKIKANLVENVARSIERAPIVSIEASLGGTWADPSLRFSTNLDNALAKAIKDSVGDVAQSQRKELEAKLNALLKERSGDLEAKVAALQTKLTEQMSGYDSQVQDKVKDATGLNLSGGQGSSPLPGVNIPSLDKLFRK